MCCVLFRKILLESGPDGEVLSGGCYSDNNGQNLLNYTNKDARLHGDDDDDDNQQFCCVFDSVSVFGPLYFDFCRRERDFFVYW